MSDIKYDGGHRLGVVNQATIQSLKIVMILANSVNPDEMLHSLASQLDLYCLQE